MLQLILFSFLDLIRLSAHIFRPRRLVQFGPGPVHDWVLSGWWRLQRLHGSIGRKCRFIDHDDFFEHAVVIG